MIRLEGMEKGMKRVTCQRRTLLLLTGLLLICISIFDQPVSVKAAVNKGKVRQAYEKQLKTLDQKWKKYYANWDGGNYFCYYDINRDGVEECLVYRSFRKEGNTIACTGGTDVAVYTYYQGKVKQLVYSTPIGGNWGAIRFYKDSKYIERFERVGWAYNANRFQAIKNGKLTTIGTVSRGSIVLLISHLIKFEKKRPLKRAIVRF